MRATAAVACEWRDSGGTLAGRFLPTASRELGRLEREQRARRYYELQLESRKTKLLEQRVKEEGRRAAVEEKRKQRQREEKVSLDEVWRGREGRG